MQNSYKYLILSALAFIFWCAANTLVLSAVPCASRFLTGACCVGAALVACSLLAWCPERERKLALPIALVVAGLFEGGYGLCQLAGWAQSSNARYAITGTFFNPGPYGGFMAMCAAAALGLRDAWNGKRWRAWLEVIALALSCLVVISMSRGAMLALALTAAILWRKHVKRYWPWIAIAVVAVAVGLYFVKSGSAHGRLVMAAMSIEAWKSAFWLGHGCGSCLYELSLAEIAYNAAHPGSWVAQSVGVAEYPFCEPLKIAVEYGLVGLLLFAGMVVFSLVSLWRQRSASFYALLALVCFSLFSYPFSLWPFTLAFWLLVGQASLPIKPKLAKLSQISELRQERQKASHAQKATTVALVLACVAGVALLATLWPSLAERREAEKTYAKFAFVKNEALIKDYYALLPKMNDDRRYLFAFGQILRDAGRYNDSNDMLRRCAQVSNDPMALVLIGRNYEDLGAISLAEQAYADAYHMMPNRLYPLYRLMLMHKAQGNEAEARECARQVADFKVRIPSPAISDMKAEAEELLRNHNDSLQ